MIRILALDSSLDTCSASVVCGDAQFSTSRTAPREHARLMLPLVQQVMAEAGISFNQLDGLAFGRGPGSFTGLRIAAGVAQGLAYGADCPVVPVSNIRGLALQSYKLQGEASVLVLIDARMDEVYWGCCSVSEEDRGSINVDLLDQERVSAPEDVLVPEAWFSQPFVAVGSGLSYESRLSPSLKRAFVNDSQTLQPQASEIAQLAVTELSAGRHFPPHEAFPVYIRDEVTWKKLPGR